MIKKARLDKRQTKRDEGIAKVDAPMSTGEVKSFPMREEIRDMLNKREHHGPKKQGFDPMRATTKELEEIRFSGFRVNVLTNNVELWCLGRVGGTRRLDLVEKNPGLLATLHEEVFATVGTIVTAEFEVNKVTNVEEMHQAIQKINRRYH